MRVTPVNYAVAKSKCGSRNAFRGICYELLSYLTNSNPTTLYDAVLIDEAQDLPIEFFRILYAMTKAPKRIIWAYDELQNLSNNLMPTVDELFGKDEAGIANVSVNNIANEAKQDIILPICYRNTPWALTIAHALGFGIYRDNGLVQLFDDLSLWTEIGYGVDNGSLSFDDNVTLKRREDSYPKYFEELIDKNDAVTTKTFESSVEEYEWVAEEIKRNIEIDELDPDDILVIFPDAINSKKQYTTFQQSLQRRDINSHLAGVTSNQDTFTIDNFVTAASIYRAKGNEAPMVYIINANWCAMGHELIKLRNVLFTAITRSRAWVRIYGVGERMKYIEDEITKVRNNEYKISFKIPKLEELQKMRLINRDRTPQEKVDIEKAERNLKEVLRLIDEGIITKENTPELQSIIDSIQKGDDE